MRNFIHKNKRSYLITAFISILILIAVLPGCGSFVSGGAAESGTKDRAEAVKLNIADISSNPVLRVAKTKGFFERNGIDATIVNFATPAEGINSLFIKQADIGWGADFPILNAVSKGEFSIVASTGTSTDRNALKWQLFVRDEIKQAGDLEGKNLSFMRGTFLTYLWDVFLTENGVDPKNVTLTGQGGSDEAYIALKNGEVDAAWVTGAVMLQKFEEIEGVHVLTDMAQTSVRIGGQIVVPDKLIEEHPKMVANFLKAVDEASQFAKENPDEVADILYDEVKQPREATLKDLSESNWNIDFTQDALDSLNRQKKYMVENGIIQTDFELADKINLEFLKEILPDRVTATP
ncbi:ABC transporter substrate-binding protein [Paenibacillus apis]|uniref:Lipoprotein n=1 Tax=Paenibacillus apis TaxID=1792174 RepID=A0A919Y1Y8_9BACL|nr:ABC transporter substrate-binding protein [Paenibacillus apis]GIO40803.1 lipoprotein [Paenibacillus apis]